MDIKEQFRTKLNFTRSLSGSSTTIFAISAALILYPAVAQDSGRIAGIVVGPSGEPMEGAYVYALAVDSPSPGGIREVTTDAKGQFLLQSVRPGRNEIHAYSPKAGYPNNLYAVFQTAPVPVVTVKPGTVIRLLQVKLGPKPGELSGFVADAESQEPLGDASVTVKWANRPEYWAGISVEQNGSFSVRVPNQPLLVSVRRSGYRNWESSAILVPPDGKVSVRVSMMKSR